MKILTVIACHTNSDLKLQCLKSNLKYFREISDKIVIINSTEFSQDKSFETLIDDDTIDVIYYENSNFLCHGKWHKYLTENDYKSYDGIVLTNDSFLVINSLKPFITKFKEEDIDALAMVNNREKKYHHQDFIKVYKKNNIKKLLDYYESRFGDYINKDDESFRPIYEYAILTEVESTFLFKNVECLYNLDLRFRDNIHFSDDLLEHCINDLHYPILKVKKIMWRSTKYDKFPDDFNPVSYIELNEDLKHMSEDEATKHFEKHGFKEGRLYKSGQETHIPEYITQALAKEGVKYG